jgi:leucyl-tRNA synthetase
MFSKTQLINLQINGKTNGRFDAPVDAVRGEIESIARTHRAFQNAAARYGDVKKVVIIPNELINFIF